MHSNRILSITLCLALACVLLTGSALAGKTSATVKSFARELAKLNQNYILPPTTDSTNYITRSMNVVRTGTQDFNLILTLGQGAEFFTGNLPEAVDVELVPNTGGSGDFTTSIVNGGKDGDTSVTFLINIGASFTAFPTLRIGIAKDGGTGTSAWGIKDTLNTLASGNIQVTVITTDSATNIEFDSGTSTVDWLAGKNGVGFNSTTVAGSRVTNSLKPTTATIDVRKGRLEFTTDGEDAADKDNGATIGIDTAVGGVLATDGSDYGMTAANKVNIIIEGDLAGVKEISYSGIILKSDDKDFNITNGVATFKLDGNNANLISADTKAFVITVDGKTVLSPRTYTLTVSLDFTDDLGGLDANDRDLVTTSTLTVWKLNGTVLIATFMNGNNALFNGRIYIYNPSSVDGNISVRVFTLPITGPSVQVGGASVDLGALTGGSGRNIRLAEDVLTPLGVTLPYTADGGNLVVEVVVEAAGVTGVGQVFQLDLSSFGIYPLASVN